jgi:nicotinate-nucleotide adenylyltransferase
MRVALMGGTFDPVHLGHLAVAEHALVRFCLDQVIWVPAGDPPHKQTGAISDQEHRYAMLLLATASNPRFQVSRFELEQHCRSFTLHTLAHFRRELRLEEVDFIIGADAILELLTWHRHEDVVASCRFLVAGRPGYDLSRLTQALPAAYIRKIHLFDSPQLEISSTEIRRRLRFGESIRYLVPDPLIPYLAKTALYSSPGPTQDLPHCAPAEVE